MSKFLSTLFGLSSATNKLPLEDVENGLATYCSRPVADSKSQRQPRIPSSNFRHIAHLLEQIEAPNNAKGWRYRPRIYTVLRGIGRLDLMNTFVERGYMDFYLPFTLASLPHEVGDDRPAFMRFQEYVLTDAKELEKGIDGRHLHLGSSGDEHFFLRRSLGSGGFG